VKEFLSKNGVSIQTISIW